MMTRHDLEAAIHECENLPLNYPNCEKLATFYTIYDHLYTARADLVEKQVQSVVGDHGDSEFLQAVKDKNSDEIWSLMDELMSALAVMNPRLYDGIMARL